MTTFKDLNLDENTDFSREIFKYLDVTEYYTVSVALFSYAVSVDRKSILKILPISMPSYVVRHIIKNECDIEYSKKDILMASLRYNFSDMIYLTTYDEVNTTDILLGMTHYNRYKFMEHFIKCHDIAVKDRSTIMSHAIADDHHRIIELLLWKHGAVNIDIETHINECIRNRSCKSLRSINEICSPVLTTNNILSMLMYGYSDVIKLIFRDCKYVDDIRNYHVNMFRPLSLDDIKLCINKLPRSSSMIIKSCIAAGMSKQIQQIGVSIDVLDMLTCLTKKNEVTIDDINLLKTMRIDSVPHNIMRDIVRNRHIGLAEYVCSKIFYDSWSELFIETFDTDFIRLIPIHLLQSECEEYIEGTRPPKKIVMLLDMIVRHIMDST